ncbi:hypothetical protein HYU17_02135 [Candidatus Woesearchaeota archaeon]|nr:hypothetical protein [Candidatus Woesearchaeota archaeon]
MLTTTIEQAISQFGSFLLFGDRIYWLGNPSPSPVNGNHIVQKAGSRRAYFPLGHGTPLSDLEELDFFRNREEVREIKQSWVMDNLDRDSVSIMDYVSRYKLLRFIVDELFPRMVAAPVEERLEAILSGGKETITGKEIVQQELGSQIKGSVINIDITRHSVDRLEHQLANSELQGQEYFATYLLSSEFRASDVDKPSIFSRLSGNTPVLVIGGKPYICDRPPEESSLEINVMGRVLGYIPVPRYPQGIIKAYSEAVSRAIRLEAFSDLKAALDTMETAVLKDVEYMPLMDVDEFRFRDIGFFRNGTVYYVFRRIPRFARQTTYDEGLFIAKESDKDGYAGEFGIGLHYKGGEMRYLGYHEQEGGVVYRGPIKEDAPFHSRVDIIDPVMRARYGQLRTICHVGGYPHFPLTPDGFLEFMTYALSNFLDSFRTKFVEQHYDAAEQARLLNAGVLMAKSAALEQGFMLTNIHHIER